MATRSLNVLFQANATSAVKVMQEFNEAMRGIGNAVSDKFIHWHVGDGELPTFMWPTFVVRARPYDWANDPGIC
jgi:hypothetical protein